MRLSFLTMLTAIVLLGSVSLVLGTSYLETQEQIEELEQYQLSVQEHNRSKVDETFVELLDEVEKLPGGYEVAGAANWQSASQLASLLYEDSEGLFPKDWGLLLALESEKRNIDPMVVYELLRVETGDTFDPELIGPETKYGKAYGLAQFMENTGPWVAEMAGLPYEQEMLFDPHYSIQLSVTYLEYLYDKYDDWNHALTAYHRGMTGLQEYIADNGDAKSWYAVEIIENAESTATAFSD
ncbi:lytic transglycosylase domain-containing protein [Alkalicoccus daliensis]|uniref:Transglycosylase SLT domain-containing protein n=1 Tax=Alkalicoccus daliensis TaxID=745820 RepID=A0A1H0BBD2_9BACI|nr:transglycosylase SLT domain-containing protein [Alkalicoccus daliensis]SDN42693.1 Transglycosylase SLT domain-containing protein [Alkalicoccus daliensis]